MAVRDCVSKLDDFVFLRRAHLLEVVDVLTGALFPVVVGVIELLNEYVLVASDFVCVLTG